MDQHLAKGTVGRARIGGEQSQPVRSQEEIHYGLWRAPRREADTDALFVATGGSDGGQADRHGYRVCIGRRQDRGYSRRSRSREQDPVRDTHGESRVKPELCHLQVHLRGHDQWGFRADEICLMVCRPEGRLRWRIEPGGVPI